MLLETILQVLQSIDGRLAAIQANGGVTSGSVGSLPHSAGPPLTPTGIDPNVLAAQQAALAAQQAAAAQAAAAQQAALASQQPSTVTADQITALIQPHIGNEQIKAELGAAMRGMGINALPETQPHQFGPLYAAFQQVIAKYTGGGAGAASSASII